MMNDGSAVEGVSIFCEQYDGEGSSWKTCRASMHMQSDQLGTLVPLIFCIPCVMYLTFNNKPGKLVSCRN